MPFEYMLYMEQATGKAPADLRIDNAKVVDVFSGAIFDACVCIGQGRILGFSTLEAKEVFDAQGMYLLPGLIDSHVHIESSMLCPARFAELVIPCGTTTVVADPHEIANVKGLGGIKYMLEASRDLPLDVRIMLSSCVPALPTEDAGASLNAEELKSLLSDPKVAGLGEMMNAPGVLGGDPDVLAKIRNTLLAGKRVDGHSPGLSGSALVAYAASGISTDHECTTVEELNERIRRGMYVLLREGSAARDLVRLLPGVTAKNASRCLFCTDDRHAVDILRHGHLDNHLRLAVKAGLDPVQAIRIASLNAAECYRLGRKGGIAPGWIADLILAQDLKDFNIRAVWCRGELTARDGKMLHSLPQVDPEQLRSSVTLAPLPENPFAVSIPSGKARVIKQQEHSLVTLQDIQQVGVNDQGVFEFARNPGMIKIAVLERHKGTGKLGVGLLDKIYGLRGGAIATTISHDSHNIVVAGDNDADMLTAVREMERLGGGVVMVAQGEVLAELPLPVGGLMSERPAEEVAATLSHMLALATSHYHIWEGADAFMTLSFMALPVIPHLKVTPRGLFDVDTFTFVSLDAGQEAFTNQHTHDSK